MQADAAWRRGLFRVFSLLGGWDRRRHCADGPERIPGLRDRMGDV